MQLEPVDSGAERERGGTGPSIEASFGLGVPAFLEKLTNHARQETGRQLQHASASVLTPLVTTPALVQQVKGTLLEFGVASNRACRAGRSKDRVGRLERDDGSLVVERELRAKIGRASCRVR